MVGKRSTRSAAKMMDTLQVPNQCSKECTKASRCDSNKVTWEQCLKIVKKHLRSEDFELLSYSESPLSDKPVGFLGEHIRLRASVLYKQQVLDLRFFIKAIPRNSSHANYVINSGAFTKEASIYATLLRDLKRVQNAVETTKLNPNARKGSLTPPDEKVTSWGPNSYFKTDEILVLEDLSVKGFSIVDGRKNRFDYDQTVVCLKTVARFHAASIIYEEKLLKNGLSNRSVEDLIKAMKKDIGTGEEAETMISNVYGDMLYEVLFVETKGHPGNDFFEASVKCLTAAIGLLKGYSKKDLEKIKKSFPGELRKTMDLVKPYENYRNVIIHGDLWTNNILFRYENDKVVEARLVDFQLCRYAPPAQDVMDLLHLTTFRKFREENLEEFLKIYHDTLRDALKLHNLDADALLPWEEFRESCEYFREMAVCTAAMWNQLIVLPSDISSAMMATPEAIEQSFRVDRTDYIVKAFKTDQIYRERLSEALNEMIERYILKP